MFASEGDPKSVISARTKHSSIESTSESVPYTTTAVPSLINNLGFRPSEGIPREKRETIIPGEPPSRGEKPVRILNNFTFFSQEQDAFAELDDLARDGYTLAIEGTGEVLAVRGDEMPDEDEDVDEPILLHLKPIIKASIDYGKQNECVVSFWR